MVFKENDVVKFNRISTWGPEECLTWSVMRVKEEHPGAEGYYVHIGNTKRSRYTLKHNWFYTENLEKTLCDSYMTELPQRLVLFNETAFYNSSLGKVEVGVQFGHIVKQQTIRHGAEIEYSQTGEADIESWFFPTEYQYIYCSREL